MTIKILENIKKYFSEFVYVRFPNRISINSFTLSDGYKVHPFTMQADLKVIIVPEFNTESSAFASATAVFLSPIDKRPMVGLYFLNFAALKASTTNEWQLFNIFAHEFTHILGKSIKQTEAKKDNSLLIQKLKFLLRSGKLIKHEKF